MYKDFVELFLSIYLFFTSVHEAVALFVFYLDANLVLHQILCTCYFSFQNAHCYYIIQLQHANLY